MIKRTLFLLYGATAYTLFVVVFGYTILFIGNIGVTPSLDATTTTDLLTALATDLGLLSLFALQHSIMARPAFKRWWTRLVPETIERSTYVLLSSVALGVIVAFWQPLGGVLWQVTDPVLVKVIYGLFALGWAILFLASFQINHFDLFGLRQVWLQFRNKPYTPIPFKTPFLYRHMRHPLYTGMMIGLWATPIMTVSHLFFALVCTAYIAFGTRLEERDLDHALPGYSQYRKQVPMYLPSPFRGSSRRLAGKTS